MCMVTGWPQHDFGRLRREQPPFSCEVSLSTSKRTAGISISAELLLLWDAGEPRAVFYQSTRSSRTLEVQTIESAEDKTVMFPMGKPFFSDCSDIIRHCVAVHRREGEIQTASVLSDGK